MPDLISKKHILIFGGAGFLGANLIHHILVAEPEAVLTIVDSLEPRLHGTLNALQPVLEKISFIKGDIRDENLLKKVISGKNIIFQCAAQTSHPLSLEDPVFDAEVNCIGNLKILLAMKKYNRDAVIVFPSSSSIIGKAIKNVIDEDHWERPLDIYSANKGVAEKYYRIFHNAYDLKVVVLRFANLFGPHGKGSPEFGFVNYFMHLARSGRPITIYGDGSQTRNLMFVNDAADIMWKVAHVPKLIGQTYFATHDNHHTIREVAEHIVKVFPQGSISYVPWPDIRKRIEIEKVLFSSQRLYDAIGWRAKYSLADGLQATKKQIDFV